MPDVPVRQEYDVHSINVSFVASLMFVACHQTYRFGSRLTLCFAVTHSNKFIYAAQETPYGDIIIRKGACL